MSHSIRFLGHLVVEPGLNPEETAWLRAYQRTRRWLHPDDPYAVPKNPVAEVDELRRRPPSAVAPDLPAGPVVGLEHCTWQPSADGHRLLWAGDDVAGHALVELRYLVDHFLRPGALAAADGREAFAPFTFDHVVSGIVAAGRDDGRLSLVLADDNELTELVLVPGLADRWP